MQIHNRDNDGTNEVLHVRQATYLESPPTAANARERARRYEGNVTMLVLDARSGKGKSRFPLPTLAGDSSLFADLTGRGRCEDLVVKDRYRNIWGVARHAKVLWHYEASSGD